MSPTTPQTGSVLRLLRRHLGHVLMAGIVALSPVMATGAQAVDAGVSIGATLEPSHLNVAVGTTVRWDNSDGERHRIRSRSGPVEFDSGNLDSGDSFSFAFSVAGTYPYFDDRDPDNPAYQGTIVVTAIGEKPPADGPPPTDPPPPAVSGDISIVNRSYQPGSLSIAVGGTVTWANNDDRAHTVTDVDGSFDSGVFNTGGTFSRTYTTAGTFAYFCVIHPDMVASITVVGDGGQPPADTPPPIDASPPVDSTPPGQSPPASVNADITVFDFGFTPTSRTINAGDTISWANTGDAPHTVTATSGTFDSGFLMSGDGFSQTFSTAGTFDYFCSLHPEMIGSITVLGSGGATPAQPVVGTSGAAVPAVSTKPAAAASGDVKIVDNSFGPRSITVGRGATVLWANAGELPHTVTDDSSDSGIIMPGAGYRRTFNTVGTFDYFCTIHPGMTGGVTVVESGAGTGSAGPAASVESAAAGRALLGLDEAAAVQPSFAGSDSASVAVGIIDLDFDPRELTVRVGAVVGWSNRGDLPHTVTATDDSYDSGILAAGDSFEMQFNEVGRYEYSCTLHPTMVGVVVVEDAGVGVSLPAVAAASGNSSFEAPQLIAASPIATGEAEELAPLGPVLLIGGSMLAVALALVGAGGGFRKPEEDLGLAGSA